MISKIIFYFSDLIDPNRIRYYVSQEKEFVYIMIPGQYASEKTFLQNYPTAKRIIVWRFDYLHFRKKISLVTYADQETIDAIQRENGNDDDPIPTDAIHIASENEDPQ